MVNYENRVVWGLVSDWSKRNLDKLVVLVGINFEVFRRDIRLVL